MKKIFLIGILLSAVTVVKAQDIHFSQFNETPVVLNPALSCTSYDIRAIANYKNQWASISSPFKTYGISIEKAVNHEKLKKGYFGTSLSILNDKAGDLSLGSIVAHVGLNYIVKVSESAKFSAGLGGGINYRSVNVSNGKWQSQYDNYQHDATIASGEGITYNSFIQPDFSAGVAYCYAKSERFISAQDGMKFNLGASVFHYNSPRSGFYYGHPAKTPIKYTAHANFDIGVKDAGVAIMPNLLYVLQGPAQEINVGCMFKYILSDASVRTNLKKSAAIAVGANYRFGDALIPAVMLQWTKYAIGLSYDINLSKLTNVSKKQGGLEISLRFNTSPGYGKGLGNEPKID